MHSLTLLAAAVAAAALTLPAQAEVLDATFTGTVTAQSGAGLALGSTISGEFRYDTASARYLSFQVGSQSISGSFTSIAELTPDLYSAFYRAQISPLAGGKTNATFGLDLEALNTPWAATSATALLGNGSALAGNLDAANSSFGYYTALADGSHVKSVTASLGSLHISAVPEPSTAALWLAGLAFVGWVGARRRG